ncbi:MAG: outer membrane protein [Kiritimatiellales bacterium]
MKKVLFILLAGITGFSFADGVRPYVRVGAGGAFLQDSDISGLDIGYGKLDDAEFDAGYVIGMAAGIASDELPVRVELSFFYQKNDIDQIEDDYYYYKDVGDISMLAFMLNGYYDFRNSSIITPYLMGGIGAVRVKVKIDELGSGSDTVAAFQLGAGVDVKVTDNISLDAGYRFLKTSDPDLDGVDMEITGHRVELGLRYTF